MLALVLPGVSADAPATRPNVASTHEVLHFAWAKSWAVRRGDWKLTGTLDARTGTMPHSLHNLAEPSPEVKDHADEEPEIVRELTALHEDWEKNLN